MRHCGSFSNARPHTNELLDYCMRQCVKLGCGFGVPKASHFRLRAALPRSTPCQSQARLYLSLTTELSTCCFFWPHKSPELGKMPNMLFQIRADDGFGHKAEISRNYMIPASLCSAETPLPDISKFLDPIVRAHEMEVLASAPFHCIGCGKQANALSHSLSKNLCTGKPCVLVHSLPICQSGPCHAGALKLHKAIVTKAEQLHPELGTLSISHPCTLCHQNKNIKKCSRCKRSYYCSVTCQRADWHRHKLCCVLCTNNAGSPARAD